MKNIFFAIGILLVSSHVYAGWMAKADYSACPRKYFPNPIVTEGPFNGEADCQTKIRQADSAQNLSCARYTCYNQTGGGEASPSASGQPMDAHISNAISAGISGDISGADAIGLASMGILGNALLSSGTPARQKTAQELEAERVAAEQAAIERARVEQQREAERDARVAPMFALLDPLPTVPAEKSNYYSKGFEHASQCISQNAGTACSGVTADQQEACVADYRAGYETGSTQTKLAMHEAYQAGVAAGKTGGLANGASDARADGPCRVEWIKRYNEGYFESKNQKKVL